MKQRRKKLLLLSALLLFAWTLWFVWPRPEPVYRGKPLSQWLREHQDNPSRTMSAFDALLDADAPVVPVLLEGLRTRNSPVLCAVRKRLPAFIQHKLPLPKDYSQLHSDCLVLLGYIAPASPEVVRELRRALATEDAMLAARALRWIAERQAGASPELQRALPDLRRLLATRNDDGEQYARAVESIERRAL